MVYPVLNINVVTSETSVGIVDTDMKDINPVLEVSCGGKEDGDMFMTLLTAFMNQYELGYEDGFDDGIWDGLNAKDDDDYNEDDEGSDKPE